MNIRRRTWDIVEVAKSGDGVSRVFDIFILALIFFNVVAVIIGSVKTVQAKFGGLLNLFETVSVVVFTAEYAARLWSCTIDSRFKRPLVGRLSFVFQPMLMIDLFAIAPFYLPFLGIDLRSLRALRLLRIIRIAKIGRYYTSLTLIRNVFKKRKN
jgi:voltage-gated potassium channel